MDNKKIGQKEIATATQKLQEYRAGKVNLENRIIENEKWWRMRHWAEYRRKDGGKLPSSGYLFNAILNKHADAIDQYPAPTVLPREESDEKTAHALSEVLPAVLERNHYDRTYSDIWWYKLKQGTGVHGVFWNAKEDDISIEKADLLNLFWEPGITDIQESENLFHVQLQNYETLKAEYPKIDFQAEAAPSIDVSVYVHDDTVSTAGKAAVVDWYYKVQKDGATVLHYCKFVDNIVLFATENEKGYENGLYNHGKYPFVFDVLYPEEGMPVGFGLIDANKDGQESIDEMDSNIQWNLRATAKQRYAVKDSAGINEEEFADLNKEIIHVKSANNISDAVMPLVTQTLEPAIVNYRSLKIEELKEVSGNREFNQGATAGGVTAASAIAQLQEAGNKLSRDAIISSYGAFTKVCILVLELIRQFYEDERIFRITEPNGSNRFVSFNNADMQAKPLDDVAGVDLGEREPIFDIKVDAQKKSPFSQISHNQFIMGLFEQGFFAPQVADQALSAVQLMEFDGKDKMINALTQNQQMFAMLQQQQSQIEQLQAAVGQLLPQQPAEGDGHR